MSDDLAGLLPDLEDEQLGELEERFIHVVIDRKFTSGRVTDDPIVGSFRGVLFDTTNPEVEFAVPLETAFSCARTQDKKQVVNSVEVQRGKDSFKLIGPFAIKAWRIQDVDISTQMCVISMQLELLK